MAILCPFHLYHYWTNILKERMFCVMQWTITAQNASLNGTHRCHLHVGLGSRLSSDSNIDVTASSFSAMVAAVVECHSLLSLSIWSHRQWWQW